MSRFESLWASSGIVMKNRRVKLLGQVIPLFTLAVVVIVSLWSMWDSKRISITGNLWVKLQMAFAKERLHSYV